MKAPKYFYFRVNTKTDKEGIKVILEDASDCDVVEVTRCRDCRWCERFTSATLGPYFVCLLTGIEVWPADYCSRANVRDKNE